MDQKVRAVTATLPGGKRTFALQERGHWTLAVQGLADPFALWRRIVAGEWSTADLDRVLSRALDGGTLVGMTDDHAARAVSDGVPPAHVAYLAALVLEAFLFGIDADRSSWDSTDPFPAGAAA